jgi:cyclase
MLKRRIIPVELLLNGRLVKSTRFSAHRDVGDPVQSSKVYSDQDADELLLLNIGDGARSFEQLVNVLREVAKCCFVPLTAGGGIRSRDDACRLFAAGADKVSLCTAAFSDTALLRDLAMRFGSQAVVVCIDVRRQPDGSLSLHSERGGRTEAIDLATHLQRIAEAGAGEVLIQSIDQDGVMTGYDGELVRKVAQLTALPVIALGGAGQIVHLKDVFDSGAEAAACGSLFNFGDNNPLRAKSLLKNYGVPLKRI